MSSLVILAESVFLRYRVERQTERKTNADLFKPWPHSNLTCKCISSLTHIRYTWVSSAT